MGQNIPSVTCKPLSCMFVSLLPLLYLCSTAKHPLYPGARAMCGVDLTTMQQLLADQRRDLITDIKEQIASEVATQLASHTARLDQMQHDQIMLRKQLSDISSQLNHNLTLSSSDHGNIQPSPSPCPGPAPGDLTMQRSPNYHSLVPAETIPCSENIQAKLVRQ